MYIPAARSLSAQSAVPPDEIRPAADTYEKLPADKVYENKEWEWGYRENDPLVGFDPYSNSKSCSELVTHSYKKSFLDEKGIAVSTARAVQLQKFCLMWSFFTDIFPFQIMPPCPAE